MLSQQKQNLNNIKLLTKEQQKSYENVKICFICKEKSENKFFKDMEYCQVDIMSLYMGNIEVLHIAYLV